jgi:hypothetical protein
MTTKNPRINVTFEEATAGLLYLLARHERQSVASLVRQLALEALEMREDIYLSKIAEKLDIDGLETCEHDDAWK